MPRSVSWWTEHDRARREAVALLIVVSGICAAYLATVLAIVLVALCVGEVGPWRGIETWQHRLGALGIAGLGVVLLAICASTIASLVWAGMARHVLRRARARLPRPGEADHAQALISSFALGVGITEPRLSIVDDPAVNAFATGRLRRPQIVLTSGALALPRIELEALCAHTVTCVSERVCPLASAAAGMVLDADWCTRAIWGMAAVVFVSGLAGVPTEVVALAILGITLLVVVTKPLVAIVCRAVVRLLDRTAELNDLETVRITNQPEALAKLMLDTVEHRQPVESTWDIAHLWFDPETTARPASVWYPGLRPIAGPDSRRTRAALVDRARVLVDLADGDSHLRTRLDHAAQAVGRGR